MKMVRVLGVLPGFVGFICLILLTASLVGIDLDSTRVDATTVPCLDDDAGGCPVGMTGSDFHVPWGFSLLDVQVNIEWSEPGKAWIGVVDAKYAEVCPPDSNGLTTCEAEDLEFVAGGPDHDDEFTFSLEPGDYRFTSAGRDGSNLDDQLVTISTTIHISLVGEILLGLVGILLMIGAIEMIYPIKLFWKKFVEA
tara:strand:- start:1818 stop:2402 length:585 start_codon:yes stop_codon:yes gene_type:complete